MKILWLLIFLFISGCSPEQSAVEHGEKLFKQKYIGENNVVGCVACHSTKQGQVIIGPSLAGLAIRAPYLVAGESGQEYIKNSITNPDAYIVEGFLPAVMFAHYSQVLSPAEIDALVEYLYQL